MSFHAQRGRWLRRWVGEWKVGGGTIPPRSVIGRTVEYAAKRRRGTNVVHGARCEMSPTVKGEGRHGSGMFNSNAGTRRHCNSKVVAVKVG